MPDSSRTRATFQHVWYEARAILALLVIGLIIYLVVDAKASQLRRDINTVVRTACLTNQAQPGPSIIEKYNDQVRVQIDTALQAEKLNTAQGLTAKAALNASTAQRLKADIIRTPKQDCYKPLLP